mmetsp:Transcript_30411/g.51144  ORF Transcript_30411/g.51144 Transcript_30411/m.51144 type:complete len:80 (-) Transcript_30411:71-310(-)
MVLSLNGRFGRETEENNDDDAEEEEEVVAVAPRCMCREDMELFLFIAHPNDVDEDEADDRGSVSGQLSSDWLLGEGWRR